METKRSQLNRFCKVLFICAIGIIIADFVIGSGLKYLYTKQRSGLLYRTTYAIDSTEADYLVIGSSRANHDYDPKIFEKMLRSSFYNCGRDKQGLIYSCAVLSAILVRHHPKAVFIDIRPDEFTQTDEGTLATLLPYQNNPAIRPYLSLNSKFESIKLLSSIYPYNSLLTNLVVGLKKDWKQDYKGYRELTNLNADTHLDTLKENSQVDTVKLKVFDEMLDRLHRLNIKAYIVISPIHYIYISKITANICNTEARKFNYHFLNFINTINYKNYRLYSDNNHLNNIGAETFSTDLANDYLADQKEEKLH